MFLLRKPEKIDFSDIALAEDDLGEATLPAILAHVRAAGRRRRPASLHKQFVGAWLRAAEQGRLSADDATEFVKDYCLVPEREVARRVLENSVVTVPLVSESYVALVHNIGGAGPALHKSFIVNDLMTLLGASEDFGIVQVQTGRRLEIAYEMQRLGNYFL